MASKRGLAVLNFERGGGPVDDDVVSCSFYCVVEALFLRCCAGRGDCVVGVDVGVFSRQNCLRQFVDRGDAVAASAEMTVASSSSSSSRLSRPCTSFFCCYFSWLVQVAKRGGV